jgi:hypothetical protein
MLRKFLFASALAVCFALASDEQAVWATTCAENGDPSTVHAETCVTGYNNTVHVYSLTDVENPYHVDEYSTAVWVDGGTGATSTSSSFASRTENAICGIAVGKSNNWVIVGYEWLNVATHLTASEEENMYSCE